MLVTRSMSDCDTTKKFLPVLRARRAPHFPICSDATGSASSAGVWLSAVEWRDQHAIGLCGSEKTTMLRYYWVQQNSIGL